MINSIVRPHLIALTIASILTWASFFGIIFFTNPQSAGIFGVIVLYVSLIVGFLSLILILWQVVKIRQFRQKR